ncbi:hypothetical protein MP638_007509, partial [Amoeboaphelidium occidentale]
MVTNDSRMITSAFDDMIIVWNLETGSILKRIWLRSTETLVRSLYLRDDQVFTGGWDIKARQVDLLSGRIVWTIPLGGKIYAVAAGSDSVFVGQTLPSHLVKADIKNGDVVAGLVEHSSQVFSLFLLDNLLFSGSGDTTIICWNTVNSEIIQRYFVHTDPVYSVAVFDGELYSGALSNDIFKWNIDDGQITKRFPDFHGNAIASLAFRSKELFSGSYDNTVVKWNASSGEF